MQVEPFEAAQPASERERRAAAPGYKHLLETLLAGGLPTVRNQSYIDYRIELIGSNELRKYELAALADSDLGKAARLLGWGFALTEFLIAPIPISERDRMRVCSLAALVNLIVVFSDHLLDSGDRVERLPTKVNGEGAALQRLQADYFRSLAALHLPDEILQRVNKVVSVMYNAQVASADNNASFCHRLWLRKCCLPFVLMALPALIDCSYKAVNLRFRYTRWLFRLGRFFGAVDDTADYLGDALERRSNYFNQHGRTDRITRRIAGWGLDVLRQWDTMVTKTRQHEISRETFLHAVWVW